MNRLLMASAAALVGAATTLGSAAIAQTVPPAVWDGVIIPDSGCTNTGPVGWRATYRPFISAAVSGANQVSQLVIYTDFQRNVYGFRQTDSSAQLNGSGSLVRFFIGSEQNDENKGSVGSPSPNAAFTLRQKPAAVTANTNYIKITGTLTANGGPAIQGCETSITGVFVRRLQPAQ